MNAVEIEQATSDLALQPFDPAEFAYAFLEAFGNKATTLKKLRSGTSNKSDLGGVLQTKNIHIAFAHTSFKWANLASHNAGVTVVIVGLSTESNAPRFLYEQGEDGQTSVKEAAPFVRAYSNSEEFVNGKQRFCLWLEDSDLAQANAIPDIEQRLNAVKTMRVASDKKQTRELAKTPHLFAENRHQTSTATMVVPRVISENREFLPVGLDRYCLRAYAHGFFLLQPPRLEHFPRSDFNRKEQS